MQLLAACLLAASGGLARQQLPDGSAPLSPSSDSSEPLHRSSRVFPFPPPCLPPAPFAPAAHGSLPHSISRSVSPAHLHASLALSLAVPPHSNVLQRVWCASLARARVGYPPSRSIPHRHPLRRASPLSRRPLFFSPGILSSRSRLLDNSAFSLPVHLDCHAFPVSFCSVTPPPRSRQPDTSFFLPYSPATRHIPLSPSLSLSRAVSLPLTWRFLSSRSLARCHVATAAAAAAAAAPSRVYAHGRRNGTERRDLLQVLS